MMTFLIILFSMLNASFQSEDPPQKKVRFLEVPTVVVYEIDTAPISKAPKHTRSHTIWSWDEIKAELVSNDLTPTETEIDEIYSLRLRKNAFRPKQIELIYGAIHNIYAVETTCESLSLANLDLRRLPTSLWCLGVLQELDLRSNQLHSISRKIEYLKVDTLRLDDNPITSLPASLFLNRSIRQLGLSHTHIEDICHEILAMINLESLYLSMNQLTNETALNIGDMLSLKTVYVVKDHTFKYGRDTDIIEAFKIVLNIGRTDDDLIDVVVAD